MANGFPVELKNPANPARVVRVAPGSLSPSYASALVNFAPAANATDIAYLRADTYGRVGYVDRIVISGTATAAAVLDVLIQRSANNGPGTTATAPGRATMDRRDEAASCALWSFSTNRTAGGNGIDNTRQLFAAGKLYLGTASQPAPPLEFRFTGPKRPMIRDLTEWVVINLNAQAIPAGCSLNIAVEWTEEALPALQMAGDSTTSNATRLFTELGAAGGLTGACNLNNSGSNGMRLQDVLLNTSSPPFPLTTSSGVIERLGYLVPGVLVLCYGLNDLRQGQVTRDQLISMIDAAIHATLNGTVNGATYTSPVGAGTTFTWPGNTSARPDTRIILWSPNSLTTDGNAGNFVTLTGRFASNTLAQAAQIITDDLYFAYDAFKNDPRVWRVVHKQDVFGRVCTTVANSGVYAFENGYTLTNAPLMTDILHPNARGQTLSARQLVPHLLEAIAEVQSLYI